MKIHTKLFHASALRLLDRRVPIIALVLLFVFIGGYIIVQSHALSAFILTEPESGTLSGNAVQLADSTASGGKAIRFGASSGGTVIGAPGIAKGVVQDDNATITQDAIDMQNAGITWDRGWVECGDASSVLDMAKALHDHGVTFLPTYNCDINLSVSSYQTKLTADMKALMPYGVHTWEIGNEMDGGWTAENNYCNNNTTPGNMTCAEAAYLVYLKAAYATVHATDPQGVVVYGGLSPYDQNIYKWLQLMLNDQSWQWMDGIAYHPYGSTAAETLSALDILKSYMVQNATWATKPIWITEYGCWSTGFTSGGQCATGSEAGKAAYITASYDALKNWNKGTSFAIRTPICWYILHEKSTVPGFGLVETTNPRTYFSAYTAVKNYTGFN